jgi:hypothetical protein
MDAAAAKKKFKRPELIILPDVFYHTVNMFDKYLPGTKFRAKAYFFLTEMDAQGKLTEDGFSTKRFSKSFIRPLLGDVLAAFVLPCPSRKDVRKDRASTAVDAEKLKREANIQNEVFQKMDAPDEEVPGDDGEEEEVQPTAQEDMPEEAEAEAEEQQTPQEDMPATQEDMPEEEEAEAEAEEKPQPTQVQEDMPATQEDMPAEADEEQPPTQEDMPATQAAEEQVQPHTQKAKKRTRECANLDPPATGLESPVRVLRKRTVEAVDSDTEKLKAKLRAIGLKAKGRK